MTAEYFSRVSYTGPTEPNLDVLAALVAAHNRSIPFENLDPVMGVPVVDLRPEALIDKLVRRRRGGYCFEHNGVMAYVLSELGFGVDILGGRVVWMNTSGELPAQTHQALAVTVPGDDGGSSSTSGSAARPCRRRSGWSWTPCSRPVTSRTGSASTATGCVLESEIRDKWEPLYLFSTRPFPMIDRRVGSWYVSTYPESHFVTGLTVALVTDDARWNLRGRNLAIHGKRQSERIRFETAAQVVEALTDRFGIDLTGLGDVEARVNQVLDS